VQPQRAGRRRSEGGIFANLQTESDVRDPILRLSRAAAFNRRIRKTVRTVVWEGDGAQSPSLDPIKHGGSNAGGRTYNR